MVLVVVSVHAGSADEKKIIELVSETADNVEMFISTEIARIGLGHFNNYSVENIPFVNDIYFCHLIDRQFDEIVVPCPAVNLITLRGSRGGMELLESLGVPTSGVLTTGDEAIELAYEAKSEEFGTGLGVNLRVASYSNVGKGFIDQLRPVLQGFARRHFAPMVSVPIAFHQWAADHLTIRQLLEGFENHDGEGLNLDTPLKVIEQTGRCRIVVTGAYHAAVFALAQGIPVVCLANSDYYITKFLGLEDQFGVGCETIRLNDPDVCGKLTAAMERAWQSAETMRRPILQAALRQIELSRGAYERVKNLVNSRSTQSLSLL